MEIDHTLTGCQQSRRDQLLVQEELSEQNRDLRETHIKSLDEMEEFKNYESMNFREEDRSKIRTLLMNSRPEFRNYKIKSIV